MSSGHYGHGEEEPLLNTQALFITNKYYHWYFQLVKWTGRRSGYTERHHIIPVCLGGKGGKENLVDLTFREHYLAHWLLTKFTQGRAKERLEWALVRMGAQNKRKSRPIASWQYAFSRQRAKELQSGRKLTADTKRRISLSLKGNKNTLGKKLRLSAERRQQIADLCRSRKLTHEQIKRGRLKRIGRKRSSDTRKLLSDAWVRRKMKYSNHWTGRRHSEETKEKLRSNKIGLKMTQEARLNMAKAQQLRRMREAELGA